jgi:hypothetical protein
MLTPAPAHPHPRTGREVEVLLLTVDDTGAAHLDVLPCG